MRKGAQGLSFLAQSRIGDGLSTGALFAFRGKSADKIKVLWWDGQGFCLFYKKFERGQFVWPKSTEVGVCHITRAQLSLLLEGIEWRSLKWSDPPEYMG
jgi:transposase